MADAADSKSAGGNIVWVRVPSSAYSFPDSKWSGKFFYCPARLSDIHGVCRRPPPKKPAYRIHNCIQALFIFL